MNFEKKYSHLENFDASTCELERKETVTFERDDQPMGCTANCWASCIGFPNR